MRYVQEIRSNMGMHKGTWQLIRRVRVGCHCGLGMMITIPSEEKNPSKIVCPECGLKYTTNFKGDIFCEKCEKEIGTHLDEREGN